jgi:hypothetical protein
MNKYFETYIIDTYIIDTDQIQKELMEFNDFFNPELGEPIEGND